MSTRSPKLFIADIKGAITKIELYIKDITFNEFEKDDKTVDLKREVESIWKEIT